MFILLVSLWGIVVCFSHKSRLDLLRNRKKNVTNTPSMPRNARSISLSTITQFRLSKAKAQFICLLESVEFHRQGMDIHGIDSRCECCRESFTLLKNKAALSARVSPALSFFEERKIRENRFYCILSALEKCG
jgi:hypothetical protein